jgi:FkbM family methyltransferase
MNIRSFAFHHVKAVAERYGVFMALEPADRAGRLKEFLQWAGVTCVLDVGANVGNYAVGLRKQGYKGRIVSFEPFPDSFAKMSAKLNADAAWSGRPYGLSDGNRDAVFQTYENGEFNSLLTLKKDAALAYQLDHDKRGQAQIMLRRLDDVLPTILEGMDNPRVFLKIDTQGHDLEVLGGASGVRHLIVGLQSEMPVIPLYDGMHSMPKMLDCYRNNGFVPIGFYPVNTFRSKQISPEFDVIFNSFSGRLDLTP